MDEFDALREAIRDVVAKGTALATTDDSAKNGDPSARVSSRHFAELLESTLEVNAANEEALRAAQVTSCSGSCGSARTA